MTEQLEALRAALELQRKYERENWPFVNENKEPTGTGESITYHLASLYQWSPAYVLSLPEQQRDERLAEIWRSFSLAGDLVKRYEEATIALLQAESKGKLVIDDIGCWIDGRKLEPGMAIRRYDEVAQTWFEGEVGLVSHFDDKQQKRVSVFSLIVPGYAPSPLQAGQSVEIISKAELYNRRVDEINRISAENREKPWLPLHDGE